MFTFHYISYRSKYLFILFCFILSQKLSADGFLHTKGTQIVDESGQEIILRGIGLGGWMLQEGYMMQTSSFSRMPLQHQQTFSEHAPSSPQE